MEGDLPCHPESKWPYFKSLIFLVDIVKPRTISNNLKSNKTRAHQDNEKSEMVLYIVDDGTELTDAQEVEMQASDTQNTAG